MIERPEKDLHESMIKGMIKALEGNGYRILQADLFGYPSPDKIGEHIPDIIAISSGTIAVSEGTRVIVEVETCKTIALSHTKEQFKEFSRADGAFFVAVPESCLEQLKENARTWGVSVDKWYYQEGI